MTRDRVMVEAIRGQSGILWVLISNAGAPRAEFNVAIIFGPPNLYNVSLMPSSNKFKSALVFGYFLVLMTITS